MKKKLNNETVLLILFIFIFIISVVGSTFAYFTSNIVGTQNGAEISSASLGNMVVSNSNISLQVKEHEMREQYGKNDYTNFASKNNERAIVLLFENGDADYGVECTYDLVYYPDIVYYHSAANQNKLREFAILGFQKVVSGAGANVTFTGNMNEADLTDVDTPLTVVSNASAKVMGRNKKAEIAWNISIRYYNLAFVQDDNADKTFGGLLKVDNLKCLYVASEGENE